MNNISLIEKVENALDEIRPYLNKDGGDIKVVSIDNNNIANVELLGNCESCPMSPMTLKLGVEEAIKKNVPEIKGIKTINFSN
jgi:Fe-S cluster biogenesis protein NfuA|tara:strand:- start:493 stop:741 length:249 start_codon:yes stop_codon:yes gene_type:complete